MDTPPTKHKHPAVARIIETIGSEEIAAHLRRTKFSVIAAKRDGLFPASWYGPLKALCDTSGLECPQSAFRWVNADNNLVAPQPESARNG